MRTTSKHHTKKTFCSMVLLLALTFGHLTNAQVKLVEEVMVTDKALYFDGNQNKNSTNKKTNKPYDYAYGKSINPHGDCIKTYKHYVFMTWYRGGKNDRHVMLTRYNMKTGKFKTIEFPHRHTGYNGKWWIGETHNTIAIGICPRNGTIHLVYDMHAYGNSGPFVNDYFRYSYSKSNVAEIADHKFTLAQFVKDPIDKDYKHCTMNGKRNVNEFSRLTYPNFFLNNKGELFLCIRKGGSHDGAMVFIKYDDKKSKWGNFKYVTSLGANAKGESHNWSIYGIMKFSGGKMRLGFQRRLNNKNDKYQYQNGVYYAYSDDPTGASKWKNYKGKAITFPLVKADETKIIEPGDYVKTRQKNKVNIVGGFDFEVTDRGDEHIVSMVKDKQYNVTKKLHTYRKVGNTKFTTVEYDAGSELYAAGNDIYVIGLKNGRANIVKTTGGTSNFKELYQHNSGPEFDKGIVHISDGKLYYYLLKDGGKGDTRTTYLQVFDLGIDDPKEELSIKMTAPANNASFELGKTITLKANATGAAKVNFRVNGTYHKQDQSSPYQVSWTPTTPGSYTIDAVAFDPKGKSLATKSRTVSIKQAQQAPTVSFKQPSGKLTVNEGYALTVVVNASDKDGTISNVKLYIDNNLVRQENVAPYEWGKSGTPKADELNGLTPGTYELKAVATDNDGLTATKKITLTVTAIPFTVDSVDAEQAPNVATNLLDGNTNDDTRWSAQGFPKSVMFDLGLNRKITGTNMWTYLNRAYQYTIEVSPYKGSGFKTLVDKTNNTSTSQPHSDNFNATGRYVKLNITGAHNYDKDWVSINEFEILVDGKASTLKRATHDKLLSHKARQETFSIYPNPARSGFSINAHELVISNISIYNLQGRLVYQNKNTENLTEVPVAHHFAKGLYIVHVTNSNQQVSNLKLIIE